MMKILHIEDYDVEKGIDYSMLLRRIVNEDGIEYENIESYSELVNAHISKYDVIILDGQFPLVPGEEPTIKAFALALQLILNSGIKKENIIVWSDSTRVHNYCCMNGFTYFSKKGMKTEDYSSKGINQKVMAQSADENRICQLILQRKIERNIYK